MPLNYSIYVPEGYLFEPYEMKDLRDDFPGGYKIKSIRKEYATVDFVPLDWLWLCSTE